MADQSEVFKAIAGIPNVGDAVRGVSRVGEILASPQYASVADAARVLREQANRVTGAGRPAIPEEAKRRPIGVSLSPDVIEMLNEAHRESGKSRSEIIEGLVRANHSRDGGLLSGILGHAGDDPEETLDPLSPEELQIVATICSSAIEAWVKAASPSRAEVTEAIMDFYRAAFGIVQKPK